jgi:hypothetical protein
LGDGGWYGVKMNWWMWMWMSFYNTTMYIKIYILKKFPLAITNLSYMSIVDIKLMAGPLCITHLVWNLRCKFFP